MFWRVGFLVKLYWKVIFISRVFFTVTHSGFRASPRATTVGPTGFSSFTTLPNPVGHCRHNPAQQNYIHLTVTFCCWHASLLAFLGSGSGWATLRSLACLDFPWFFLATRRTWRARGRWWEWEYDWSLSSRPRWSCWCWRWRGRGGRLWRVSTRWLSWRQAPALGSMLHRQPHLIIIAKISNWPKVDVHINKILFVRYLDLPLVIAHYFLNTPSLMRT